jgi:hypothetical protein
VKWRRREEDQAIKPLVIVAKTESRQGEPQRVVERKESRKDVQGSDQNLQFEGAMEGTN